MKSLKSIWILPLLIHSVLFSAVSLEKFGGIGLHFQYVNDTSIVVSTVSGEPAHLAGIQRDDRLISINGATLIGKDRGTVISMLRGEPGSQAIIEVLRSDDFLEFPIWREQYIVRTMEKGDLPNYVECESLDSLHLCAGHFDQFKSAMGAGKNARYFADGIELDSTNYSIIGKSNVYHALELNLDFTHDDLSMERCDNKERVELSGVGAWYLALVTANGQIKWKTGGDGSLSSVTLPKEVIASYDMVWCRIWQRNQ